MQRSLRPAGSSKRRLTLNVKLVSVLLPLYVMAATVPGQTTGGQAPDRAQAPGAAQKLELRTEVMSQTYCSTENLRLMVRLTFVNSGSETVILYRGGALIARQVVSRNLNSLLKGKYESDVSPMLTGVIPPEVYTQPSEQYFAILKPGESYATTKETHLFVNDGPKSDFKLRPGRHFLRLRVATWFADPAHARELSQRWNGTLWYWDVVSQPMEFTIKPYDPADTCN